MADEATKVKQGYLRTEILDKGYDASKFVDFLASRRQNGEDIEVWSQRSLEDMVTEFQSKEEKPVSVPQSPSRDYGEVPRDITSMDSAQSRHKKEIQPRKVVEEEEAFIEETQQEDRSVSPTKPQVAPFTPAEPAKQECPPSPVQQADPQKLAEEQAKIAENEKLMQEMKEKALKEKKSTIVGLF